MGYETDIATGLLNVACTFCGKPLRVPESIERGFGPDCDLNYMMGSGAAGVVAKMEAYFDEAEAEAAIRTAPDTAPETWIEPIYVAKEGAMLEGGVLAKGGEILKSRPIRPGSLREYWLGKGDAWRTSIDARQQMVSYGIWYASRAVTFGFTGAEVSDEKVDPRFLVVAAVQRFARAVGMTAAADRMANFYAARVVKVIKAKLKARDKDERDAIIFETDVPPSHRPFRNPVGPGMIRIHAPYSEQYNRLARENKKLFVAFEKDPPYFWRYFHQSEIRHVVNICQSAFGDRPSITRPMRTLADRQRRHQMKRIVDTWTGEVRLFPPDIARRLLTEQPKTKYKSQQRYQEV